MYRGAPRIAPLTDDELDAETRALLPTIVVDGAPTTGRSNVLRTLVRHRPLFPRWTPFLDGLLNGTLPARDRELLVLRTASNCRCDYQWGQHARCPADRAHQRRDPAHAVDQMRRTGTPPMQPSSELPTNSTPTRT